MSFAEHLKTYFKTGSFEEAFQYVPLREFYAVQFQSSPDLNEHVKPYPESAQSYIVFVNGVFNLELSVLPPQIVVLPLSEAKKSYGHFLKARAAKNTLEDPFVQFNETHHSEGAFVYVPPKTKLEAPVQVIHLYNNSCYPRIQVLLGADAKIDWITTRVSTNQSPVWCSDVLDVALEDNAAFSHYDLLQVSPDNWYFEAIRCTLKTGSKFDSISFTQGAKSVRQDYRIHLLGENASANIQGVAILNENRQSHTHVLMQHMAPHCHSNQMFKNILHDNSRSSFQGKIFVHPKAQKTQAYQINNNLLLGQHAIANSKPNLEIFADDVKASHGATVGQLDKEELFYLRTRGLPEELANQFLIKGFFRQIIDQIPYASIRESLQC